jgi:hypothetical protein
VKTPPPSTSKADARPRARFNSLRVSLAALLFLSVAVAFEHTREAAPALELSVSRASGSPPAVAFQLRAWNIRGYEVELKDETGVERAISRGPFARAGAIGWLLPKQASPIEVPRCPSPDSLQRAAGWDAAGWKVEMGATYRMQPGETSVLYDRGGRRFAITVEK